MSDDTLLVLSGIGVSRYEVHLDRKLERMLTMLLRLKDLRRMAEPT
jgi:hypothetical protein